jgi:hypothetical protein
MAILPVIALERGFGASDGAAGDHLNVHAARL